MSRRAEPGRKAELLSQILDYLIDKPLSKLTFRSAATALGVSTFTLVYQFGTRAELVADIISAITSRQRAIEERLLSNAGNIDAYYENLEISWNWTLEPRNRQLQRLEFEAAMLGVLDPQVGGFGRTFYETWLRVGKEALQAYGLTPAEAEIEARIVVDAFYGLQFDLLVNDQVEATTAALKRFMAEHRHRIETHVADRA